MSSEKEELDKAIEEAKKALGDLDKAMSKYKEVAGFDYVSLFYPFYEIHETIQELQELLRDLREEMMYRE